MACWPKPRRATDDPSNQNAEPYSRLIGQSSRVFNQGLEPRGVRESLGVNDSEAVDHVLVGQKQETHSQGRIACECNYHRIEREGQIHELVVPRPWANSLASPPVVSSFPMTTANQSVKNCVK